jgi:DegV family protein with EDD domain
MDTLEYLQKGGRIGDAIKWMGILLQVKPLVSINHQTGRVEPVALTRTHKSLVETMYNKFFAHFEDFTRLHIAVLHGNAQAEAEVLAERIRAEYNPVELVVNITGPVLGINTGPRPVWLFRRMICFADGYRAASAITVTITTMAQMTITAITSPCSFSFFS